ncbi:hypothetical protein CRG98_004565 [Punica granatum]|uniref:Uncharacterized protein n=1 Tax=Punica granatum TaxID=22663 RepID=A0A2I0L302_PUNGR|nr:hypothetical protein CRG98_004565 [Punica granatum]
MLCLASGYKKRVGEVFESQVTRLNAWKGARVQRVHVWAHGQAGVCTGDRWQAGGHARAHTCMHARGKTFGAHGQAHGPTVTKRLGARSSQLAIPTPTRPPIPPNHQTVITPLPPPLPHRLTPLPSARTPYVLILIVVVFSGTFLVSSYFSYIFSSISLLLSHPTIHLHVDLPLIPYALGFPALFAAVVLSFKCLCGARS